MKFLFLGAGAIGTYLGGSLAIAGHDVAFVERREVAEVIRDRGLIVHRGGQSRTERGPAAFTDNAAALDAGPYDACVVALKSFDTEGAIDALVATGRPVPPVLSLQNGVDNEPLIAQRLGADAVIAGTLTSAIGKPAVAEVVEEKQRGVGIAEDHVLSPRLIEAFSSARLTTRGYADAGAMKWSKVLTNLTGNATSAILDLSVAAIFADRRLCHLELEVQRECLAVLRALGHQPVDLPGTPVRLLALATRLPERAVQPLLSRFVGGARGDKMPSFHIDLYSGRGRTEVHWLNGAVVRHGARVGVPTPVNRVLTDTLQGITDGTVDAAALRHRPDALLRLIG